MTPTTTIRFALSGWRRKTLERSRAFFYAIINLGAPFTQYEQSLFNFIANGE